MVGEALHSPAAGAAPPFDCSLGQPRLGKVMRHNPRLAFGPLWKAIANALGDLFMQLLPAALEKRRIGCLLDKRMLEGIGHLGRCFVAKDEPCSYQFTERFSECYAADG